MDLEAKRAAAEAKAKQEKESKRPRGKDKDEELPTDQPSAVSTRAIVALPGGAWHSQISCDHSVYAAASPAANAHAGSAAAKRCQWC